MPTEDLILLWLPGTQLDSSIQKTEGLLEAAVAKQAELRARLDASKAGRQDSVRPALHWHESLVSTVLVS